MLHATVTEHAILGFGPRTIQSRRFCEFMEKGSVARRSVRATLVQPWHAAINRRCTGTSGNEIAANVVYRRKMSRQRRPNRRTISCFSDDRISQERKKNSSAARGRCSPQLSGPQRRSNFSSPIACSYVPQVVVREPAACSDSSVRFIKGYLSITAES